MAAQKKSTITKVLRANLRAIVAAYRAAEKVSLATVSKRYYGNADFLARFFAGEHSISVDKLDGMITAIRAEWPKGAEWPYCQAVIIAPPQR